MTLTYKKWLSLYKINFYMKLLYFWSCIAVSKYQEWDIFKIYPIKQALYEFFRNSNLQLHIHIFNKSIQRTLSDFPPREHTSSH